MAADLALVRQSQIPVLRFYAWSPSTISLGYHQDFADIDEEKCQRDRIDIVRRPTGGRAIFHAEELTYSVVLPAYHPLQHESVNSVYQHISKALLLGLQIFGVDSIDLVKSQNAHRDYAENGACFASSVNFEITAMQRKLIGSAQRRFKEGILQHGSLLTGAAHEKLEHYLASGPVENNNSLQTKAISLEDILGARPDMEKLKAAIATGFERFFKISFIKSEMTAQERNLAEKLTLSFQQREVVL